MCACACVCVYIYLCLSYSSWLFQLSSVQSLSSIWLFATPWTAACKASLSITNSQFTQTHVHWVGDAIQQSHPLSSPSLPTFNLSQCQGLFKWVNSSYQVARVLEFQHQPFQWISSVQFSSVTESCPILCRPMNHSTSGLPVHHQLLEFTQTHVHRVGDAIQPSHSLSSPSTPAFNLFLHLDLFKWVSSSHQVVKILEFQLQHQSFQWTPRTDLL